MTELGQYESKGLKPRTGNSLALLYVRPWVWSPDFVLCDKAFEHSCSAERWIQGKVLVEKYTDKTLVTEGPHLTIG
jgi:hypothetical protein